MKKSIYIFFLVLTCGAFSQEMLIKSFFSDANSIEISTEGLDEITIQNSEKNQIEISLFDENPNSHYIFVDDETSIVKIGFKLQFLEDEPVFRKYITKRLHRASVVVKLPKNKDLTIVGKNIDVISKSYIGNLSIYINKGLVDANQVQQNITLKLFQGNVVAETSNSNVAIKSNTGKILVNEKFYSKKYKKTTENAVKTFSVTSIHANVTLTEF